MALNDAATLVIGTGHFFTNDVDEGMPASLLNPASEGWEEVGHTSLEDIFAMASEGGEATTLGTLQNKTLRTTYSNRVETFTFTLQQFDKAGLKLYYGSNATVGSNGELQVPQDPQPTVTAFLAVFIDGDNTFAFHAPKAEIFRAEDMSLSDTESLAGLPISVKPLVSGSNTWAYAVTPLAATSGGGGGDGSGE